jgi:hypothetical protein
MYTTQLKSFSDKDYFSLLSSEKLHVYIKITECSIMHSQNCLIFKGFSMYTSSLTEPHRKKSIGVRSRDHGATQWNHSYQNLYQEKSHSKGWGETIFVKCAGAPP